MAADLSLSIQHQLESIVLGTASVANPTFTGGTARTTVADASTAHALNATFSDTEVEAALNALGVKINAILASLEAFDIHASS